MIIMVRTARKRSNSGIYHVIMRGINRQDIFFDTEDYHRFLETLELVKADKFNLLGYCLMSNHIHMLIHEKAEEIHHIMKRIGTSYARWYNRKYQRSGHVFQGRYGSECVEDDKYLLTVIRYIHNNPLAAGIVLQSEDYPWSSLNAYYSGSEYPSGITDSNFILEMFANEPTRAIFHFRAFMNEETQEKCLEDVAKIRKADEDVKLEIEAILNGQPISALQTMEKPKRNELLRMIKGLEGVTQRQIARLTGLNQNIVFKA